MRIALLQVPVGIDRRTLEANFVVQMRRGGPARSASPADDLSTANDLTGSDEELS